MLITVLPGSLFMLFALISVGCSSDGTCFYHQTDSYYYQENFRSKTCDQKCTVAPFVSPDTSMDAHLSMIKEAKTSITIANPVFDSWNTHSRCTKQNCHKADVCTGCSLDITQNETNPLFIALLEAIQVRQVAVKILTNNYSVPTCSDSTTLLDWLFINGAEVRYYKTTVFLHAKFMMVDDGAKVLISSVNFSKTSFRKNRETGVIVSDCSCDALDLYASVFQYDWEKADKYVLTNTYTQAQEDLIKTPLDSTTQYTPVKTYSGVEIVLSYVGPDYARETFFKQLNQTKTSLLVHIYDITDKDICKAVAGLHENNGVSVDVLVSNRTASFFTHKIRKKCFQQMEDVGISVTKVSSKCFDFSHQKYWVIDDTDVHLSTGNWDSSDFLNHDSNKPINPNKDPTYVSRDMLIVMRSVDIVGYFKNLFNHDKNLGSCD